MIRLTLSNDAPIYINTIHHMRGVSALDSDKGVQTNVFTEGGIFVQVRETQDEILALIDQARVESYRKQRQLELSEELERNSTWLEGIEKILEDSLPTRDRTEAWARVEIVDEDEHFVTVKIRNAFGKRTTVVKHEDVRRDPIPFQAGERVIVNFYPDQRNKATYVETIHRLKSVDGDVDIDAIYHDDASVERPTAKELVDWNED